MIPQRTPSNEIFGNGLKGRVTACRKRLRVNRNVPKSHSNDQPVAFGREAAAAFLNEYPAVRESPVSERDSSEFPDVEAWQGAEQEVGIT